MPDRSTLRKKRLHFDPGDLYDGGEGLVWQCDAAGHIASSQRDRSAGVQFPFLPFLIVAHVILSSTFGIGDVNFQLTWYENFLMNMMFIRKCLR